MDGERGASFLELQAIWYLRLKDEGFVDIETKSGLLSNSGQYDGKADHFTLTTTREYYLCASEFLVVHEFKTSEEKKIWELYSEGSTFRVIAGEIKKSPSYVFQIVKLILRGPFEAFKRERIFANLEE